MMETSSCGKEGHFLSNSGCFQKVVLRRRLYKNHELGPISISFCFLAQYIMVPSTSLSTIAIHCLQAKPMGLLDLTPGIPKL